MADDDYGGLDEWSRLARRLRDERQTHADAVLSGSCDSAQYQSLCARISQIDETLALMSDIRAGRDRPRKREPLKHPEE